MNRRTRRILATLGAWLTLAIGLAACATTGTVNRPLDDSTLREAVKDRLAAARLANTAKIKIDVTNGVVTLAGEVPNAEVAERAPTDAVQVPGVVRVINHLRVKSPPTV